MTESPVMASRSSVDFLLYCPPISRVPDGEAQLEWWPRPSTSWCDGLQLPPLNLTQVVLVLVLVLVLVSVALNDPQASSPVCVCPERTLGRSGREHQWDPFP